MGAKKALPAPNRSLIPLILAFCGGLLLGVPPSPLQGFVGSKLSVLPLNATACCEHAGHAQVQVHSQRGDESPQALAPADAQVRLPGLEPLLQIDELRRGLTYYGTGRRLERMAAKLHAREPVTAVVIGGSVAFGAGSTRRGTTSFAARLFQWINATYPHPDHVLANKAVPATDSGFFALCMETIVPPAADLVVLEFTVQEDKFLPFSHPRRRLLEQLVRKLMQLPNAPALLMVHHYGWYFSFGDGAKNGLFYSSAEAEFSTLAQYYDIPSVSVRAALWHHMKADAAPFKVSAVALSGKPAPNGDKIPGLCANMDCAPSTWADYFYWDSIHPTDTGHAAMAELLVSAITTALGKAGARGGADLSEAAAVELRMSLPEPMVPGNEEVPTNLCAVRETMNDFVKAKDGFEWKAERPNATTATAQKWGWTSTQPGAWLELEVSTLNSGDNHTAPVFMLLGYLRSYVGMGVARIECVSGCKCDPTFVDASWEDKVSLTQMHPFQVSQHAQCRVRMTTVPRDSPGVPPSISQTNVTSPGNKVSWAAVLVSEFHQYINSAAQADLVLEATS